MHIAVNTRLLLPNKLEGIGWFMHETVKRITEKHSNHQFSFIFDRPWDESFIYGENVRGYKIFPQSRHPFLWYWWFEYSVPALLNKLKPDLFLSPDGYLSLRTNVPQLPVIHDLNFEHYPKDLPYLYSKYYRKYFPLYAKKAARISTVSEYSKADISKLYEIDSTLIDVVYNGGNENFKPLSDDVIQKVRNQSSQGCPFVLFVGSLHPRKNLQRLFPAFDSFKKSMDSNVKLLVVGEAKWWTKEIKSAFDNMTFKEDVIFCGRQSSDELQQLVPSALCMAYVSIFEGFGIPIIEAMRSGVPVITSNVTSMPETAGDAAILVDPFDVNDIANAITKIYSDEAIRKSMVEKGLKRSLDFSWDKSSDLLWDSIEKTISMHT